MARRKSPGLLTRMSLLILPTLLRASLRWTQRMLIAMWETESMMKSTPENRSPSKETARMMESISPLTTMDIPTIEDLQSSIQQLITRLRSRRS